MPVVEKIESISKQKNGFMIYRNVVSIDNSEIKTIQHINDNRTKIEAVYDAVIYFIKWYNEQNS